MSPGSCLYDVTVTHRRVRPTRHDLRYRITSLLLDLDEAVDLPHRFRMIGMLRGRMVGFRQSDHGQDVDDADPRGLRRWVERTLDAAGLGATWGRIRILCMPRMFGHAFNPLSVFFCDDPDGAARATIYQVDNTFGQRHFYVVSATPDAHGVSHQTCDKQFYVSPFMPMEMRYRFTLREPDAILSIGIIGAMREDGAVMITTSMRGERRALSDRALLRALARMPFLGLNVLLGIHWQALLLWRKGLRFHRRPSSPASPISMGS